MRWRLVVALVGVVAAPAAAQRPHYEGGVSAATGRYIFADRTTSITLSTGLAWTAGPVTIRGSVPVWLQNTTLISATPAGSIPSGGGGRNSEAVRDSSVARRRRGAGGMGGTGGMPAGSASIVAAAAPVVTTAADEFRVAVGDPVLSGVVRAGAGVVSVSAGFGVKVPVTDTSRFGTGRWDLGGSASISVRADRRTVVAVDGSYWHLGDLAELDFRDPVAATASVARLVGTSWGVALMGSAASSPIAGFPGPATVGGAVSRFSRAGIWSLTVSAGLTETSPDLGLGVSWRVRL